MQEFNKNYKNSGKKMPSRSGYLTGMILSAGVFFAVAVTAVIFI